MGIRTLPTLCVHQGIVVWRSVFYHKVHHFLGTVSTLGLFWKTFAWFSDFALMLRNRASPKVYWFCQESSRFMEDFSFPMQTAQSERACLCLQPEQLQLRISLILLLTWQPWWLVTALSLSLLCLQGLCWGACACVWQGDPNQAEVNESLKLSFPLHFFSFFSPQTNPSALCFNVIKEPSRLTNTLLFHKHTHKDTHTHTQSPFNSLWFITVAGTNFSTQNWALNHPITAFHSSIHPFQTAYFSSGVFFFWDFSITFVFMKISRCREPVGTINSCSQWHFSCFSHFLPLIFLSGLFMLFCFSPPLWLFLLNQNKQSLEDHFSAASFTFPLRLEDHGRLGHWIQLKCEKLFLHVLWLQCCSCEAKAAAFSAEAQALDWSFSKRSVHKKWKAPFNLHSSV